MQRIFSVWITIIILSTGCIVPSAYAADMGSLAVTYYDALPPSQQLISAARSGREAEVHALLALPDIRVNEHEWPDKQAQEEEYYYGPYPVNGDTALVEASKYGHTTIVKALLAAGAQIDTVNYRGDTALQWAAYGGHEDIVRLLLAQQADINSKNKEGATPLMRACISRCLPMVQFLLENKANVKEIDERGDTALTHAQKSFLRYENQSAILELLAVYGSMVKEEDDIMVKPA